MIVVRRLLLCLAALSSTGYAAVRPQPRWGELGRRIPLQNGTATAATTSGSTTTSTSLLTTSSTLGDGVTYSTATSETRIPPSSGGASLPPSYPAVPVIPSNVTTTRRGGNYSITSVPFFTTSTPLTGCSITTDPETVTYLSIVHTSTTTIAGDIRNYTAPFPAVTPSDCSPDISPTNRLTVCATCQVYKTSPASVVVTPELTPVGIQPTTSDFGTISAAEGTETTTQRVAQTTTITTTDKNPVVVYSTVTPPNYGVTTTKENIHQSAADDPITTPLYGGGSTGQAAETGSAPDASPITVVVEPSQVIIQGSTFTDNPQSKTSTVVVDSNTFTIEPSRVVGAGVTVDRSATSGGVFVPAAATTNVGDLQVIYGSSVVTIDGSVFTLGPSPSAVVVEGETITLEASEIILPSQTISIGATAAATNVAVLGGELITLIGQSVVVIEGTTITYGPASSTITDVIDGDTVIIGPSGVTAHGTSYGGITAAPSATTYELVGGATITELGTTAVVISGTTYNIGPGVSTTVTTVVGNRTLTIGPSGVSDSSTTLAHPTATTTIITPAGSSAITTPTASASPSTKNDGRAQRPSWLLLTVELCIAIGVGHWSHLLS